MRIGGPKRFLNEEQLVDLTPKGVLIAGNDTLESVPSEMHLKSLAKVGSLRVTRLSDSYVDTAAARRPSTDLSTPSTFSLKVWQIIAASPSAGLTTPPKPEK